MILFKMKIIGGILWLKIKLQERKTVHQFTVKMILQREHLREEEL